MHDMPAFSRVVAVAVMTMLQAFAVATRAENWPGWRKDGSGISAEQSVSIQWDAKTNIVWKVPVPGEGNSSPVIWDQRLYLTSATDNGKKRLVLCYDAATGQPKWTQEFDTTSGAPTHVKNGHASPTAATDGQRVYVFFDSIGLIALDAVTGKTVWKFELGPFQAADYLAASPILVHDMVVMVCDVGQNTHEGKLEKNGFIMAVDKATGQRRWRTVRKPSSHAATPLAIRVGDRTQIIASGDPVIAYDAETGKEIWSCRGMKSMCAPSPLFDGTLVWVTSGRNGPAMTIDPTGTGDVRETHGRMLAESGGPYVPSPLLCPFLMLPGDDGRISFLDKSGQMIHRMKVPGHFTASPIGVGNRIYWPEEKGRTYVLDVSKLTSAERSVTTLAVNELGETILASPAVSNGRLFLRTISHLYCIAGSATVTSAGGPAPAAPSAPTLSELQTRYQEAKGEEGPDINIRIEVVDAVAAMKEPEALAFLLKIFQRDPHWDVGEAAAKAIARRGAEATDALLKMLTDWREFSSILAADALGEIGEVRATATLIKKTGDNSHLVRLSAMRALGRIAQAADADLNDMIPAMIKRLTDADMAVRLATVQALSSAAIRADSQRPVILEGLRQAVGDKNAEVSKAATKALNKLSESAGQPARSEVQHMTGSRRVYVGTYTGPASKGIYMFDLDLATGELTKPELAGEVASPSFLTLDRTGKFLYSVSEVWEFAGKKNGMVSAFAIEPESGKLRLLNQQPSGGTLPCHVCVDRNGKNVLVANYATGTVCVLPLDLEGRLGAPSQVIQHSLPPPPPGSGKPKEPFAHSIYLDAAERFAFAVNLGLDRIFAYRFDSAQGRLTADDALTVSLPAGSGPRHFAFHPGGRTAYVVNEMASTVTAFSYEANIGRLVEIQTVSALPPDFKSRNTMAEIQVHPTGRFLYASNRGHDSVAVFAIDSETGKLTLVEHQATQGKTPRHFGIDPTGTYLLAANQSSGTVVVFRIDPRTGRLTPTGATASIASPVCVKFR